jgi:type II secretory pathway pseudopilin PulG
MYLAGQEGQRGYAMAALLIMIGLLSIGMIALLPVWRQQAQREKEAELAFRGEQYARAIYLFRTKNGNQPPPNIDVLVQGKYLRKKYKDPITGEDFQPIFGGQQPQPGAPGRGGAQLPGGVAPGRGATQGLGGASQGRSSGAQTITGSAPGRGGAPTPTGVGRGSSGQFLNPQAVPDRFGPSQGPGGAQGGTGLVTVQSKSKEASIRIYNNASHYNEWQFLYNARGRGGLAGDGGRSGQPGIGTGGPGGRSGPGSGPGGGRGPGAGGRGRGFGPGGGRG